ncbi:conserved hypothetical protein [Theileria equi strain WA]|uniref:Uncharacterized protein n=1 Tax=Theileria equi strain WA TaxID=1537102 RepID=L1LAW4_THEEQ|nr:conserved hypothetical protein [Theileria equi strain WA]EKX72425.1 conserved hypothetical protein [Theileria equi strain WA]|eukprot:XP_004831877.1 conserved hypothetical protein [Theileria equi strain WA]
MSSLTGNIRYKRLLDHVNTLLRRKNVRFSKPLGGGGPKCSVGGLRHYGEWISTLEVIKSNFSRDPGSLKTFLSSGTGLEFVDALKARVCSLRAKDIFRLLLAIHEVNIISLEENLVAELVDSLDELDLQQLLMLPKLLHGNYELLENRLNEAVSKRISESDHTGVAREAIDRLLKNSH